MPHGYAYTKAQKERDKKKSTKIQKEIDRIEKGGKTLFKSKEDSLTSLKKKLEISTRKSSTTKPNLKERIKQQSTKEARMARRNKRLAKKGIRIPKKK